jgi:hypothetical protein
MNCKAKPSEVLRATKRSQAQRPSKTKIRPT